MKGSKAQEANNQERPLNDRQDVSPFSERLRRKASVPFGSPTKSISNVPKDGESAVLSKTGDRQQVTF